jgi:hypothetical protein
MPLYVSERLNPSIAGLAQVQELGSACGEAGGRSGVGCSKHPQEMRRWLPMRGPKPRSFEEVVAAQEPTVKARLERGEHFSLSQSFPR